MFNTSVNSKSNPGETGTGIGVRGREKKFTAPDLLKSFSALTGLSHEMRTQLNAVVSFSYLLINSEYNYQERDEFIDQIFSSCEQLIVLFDNFLDSGIIFSSAEVNPDYKNCNPDKFFDDLFTEFRGLLSKKTHNNLILVCENQPFKVDELIIDTNRLAKIIRNLFQNAIQNTRSGYIKVGYYLKDEKLHFSILDSGEGFEKSREFVYTDDITKSLSMYNDIYSAVNLIFTRQLIEMLEGSITVECNGLTGTGIFFSVPVKYLVPQKNPDIKNTNSPITI